MTNVIPLAKPGAEPDAVLVRAALADELWAKEALFRRHARRLLGQAFRLVPEEDPEDLVQETFILAFRYLHRLENHAAFAGWSSSVLVSLVRGKLRKARRWRLIQLTRHDPVDLQDVISRDAPAEVVDALSDVYKALGRLTEEQRIALVLQRVEGLELAEVAERMGVSIATVKRRVAEADVVLGGLKNHE